MTKKIRKVIKVVNDESPYPPLSLCSYVPDQHKSKMPYVDENGELNICELPAQGKCPCNAAKKYANKNNL